ncbi:putative mitochondrial protein, partial [Mucuna pruriens]
MEEMKNQFEMSNLGEMNYYLSLEVYQFEDGTFLNQEKYAHEILKKFRMESYESVPIPLVLNLKISKEDGTGKNDASFYKSFIGTLLYLTSSDLILCLQLAYSQDSVIDVFSN